MTEDASASGTIRLPRPLTSTAAQTAVFAIVAIVWLVRLVQSYTDPAIGGFFRWIGVDFGFYLAQARAFAAGDMAALYSVPDLGRYAQPLAAFTTDPATPLAAGPVPYPPVFAWLLSPLASVSPPLAFGLWLVPCAIAALALAWRVVTRFPADRRILAAALLLAATPFVFSLWFGQAQIFLSLAFGEAFFAFRKGRDLRAGLWLSVLILKPQYLLIIVPLLLWKRRWSSIGGMAVGGVALLAASAVVAGPQPVIDYVASLLESVTASGGVLLNAVAPEVMVNWRALVLHLPVGSDTVRLGITAVLSLLTVVVVLAAWRGPWRPAGPRFAALMTLVAIGTVLASYHSHSFGALMLAVPLAAYLAEEVAAEARERTIDVAIAVTVVVGILGPWLWFAVLGRGYAISNTIMAATLVVGLVLFLVRVGLPDRSTTPADDTPVSGGTPTTA